LESEKKVLYSAKKLKIYGMSNGVKLGQSSHMKKPPTRRKTIISRNKKKGDKERERGENFKARNQVFGQEKVQTNQSRPSKPTVELAGRTKEGPAEGLPQFWAEAPLKKRPAINRKKHK